MAYILERRRRTRGKGSRPVSNKSRWDICGVVGGDPHQPFEILERILALSSQNGNRIATDFWRCDGGDGTTSTAPISRRWRPRGTTRSVFQSSRSFHQFISQATETSLQRQMSFNYRSKLASMAQLRYTTELDDMSPTTDGGTHLPAAAGRRGADAIHHPPLPLPLLLLFLLLLLLFTLPVLLFSFLRFDQLAKILSN